MKRTIKILIPALLLSLQFHSCADTEAPTILDTTVLKDTTDTIGPYEVLTTVIDDREVKEVFLNYGTEVTPYAGPEFATIKMESIGNDQYRGEIPGGFAPGTTVLYFIEAVDHEDNRSRDPATDYYRFKILEPSVE